MRAVETWDLRVYPLYIDTSFMEKQHVPEATAFWEYYFKYEQANDSDRKELAESILNDFCTLEGNYPLANYTTNYCDLKERIDRIESDGLEYPIDLFDNLTIESIKLMQKYWRGFLALDYQKYGKK